MQDLMNGVKLDLDTGWFFGFWLLLAVFALIESVFPAFQEAPRREVRWPTNLGLGVINMFIAPVIPVSEVIGAE